MQDVMHGNAGEIKAFGEFCQQNNMSLFCDLDLWQSINFKTSQALKLQVWWTTLDEMLNVNGHKWAR